MKANKEQNAITQRIEMLQSGYRRFRENPKSVFCHWAVADDEVKMMDAFVQYEHSELGIFPDFFFPLISPFSNARQYSQSLLDEINDWVETGTADLREKGYRMDFSKPSRADAPSTFLTPLSSVAETVSGLAYVVAVLRPTEVHDFKAWENWMIEVVQGNIPSKVRMMVWLTESQSNLSELRAKGREKVQTIVPDLDMPGAMRQLAATGGNPSDPSVQFRLLFLDMGQAASAKDFDKMKALGEKALHLVQQQKDWEYLEVTVYASMGNFMFPYPAYQKEALQFYRKAHHVAELLYKNKHPLGVSLFIQTHHFLGAVLVSMKNYEDAASIYEAAVPVTRENGMFDFQQMESWRMAGFCYLQSGKNNKAWECYWNALEMAEKVNEQVQAEPTFLSIGAGLKAVMKSTGDYSKEAAVKNKMTALAGEGWAEKIESQKIKP